MSEVEIKQERGWKRYPAYKDSGVEWLGKIPEHWEVKRLKYISRLTYGDSLSGDTKGLGDIPVYGSNGLVGIQRALAPNTFAPCIIIGRKGSCGKITYSESCVFAIDTTYFIDARTVNSSICLKWLFYVLSLLELDKSSQDTGVPGLSREFAHNQLLPWTGLIQQQAIARFLDRETVKIDTLIAKKERLIELLKEKRTALISHAVTKGLNPDAPMKDSGIEWLGKIPEGWNLIRLKYGYKTCLGKMLQSSPSSSEDSLEPYLRAANISWEGVNLADLKEMYFSPYEKSLYELKAGDLVVSEGGDVGRTAIWRGEIDNCYIQNAVHRIRNRERYSNPFLYYWLFFIKSIGYIDLLCNKATIAHFTVEKVREIPVASPPLTEQQAIAQFLDRETAKIDTLVTKTRISIDKLKEYRTALISAAVTGKIDIRENLTPSPN